MADDTGFRCFYCKEPIDPLARLSCTRITGWEQKAWPSGSRRGGSDILMRQRQDQFAHRRCVLRAKDGVHVGQGSLLDA